MVLIAAHATEGQFVSDTDSKSFFDDCQAFGLGSLTLYILALAILLLDEV